MTKCLEFIVQLNKREGVTSGTSPVSWVYQCSHHIAARLVAGGVWSALRFLCWQSAETSSLPRSTRCPRCQSHLYPSRWIIDHCQNIYYLSLYPSMQLLYIWMLDLNVDFDPNCSTQTKRKEQLIACFGGNHLLKRERFTVYPSITANGK